MDFTPQIARNLSDEDGGVRYAALEALGRIGLPAAAFVPNIASLAEDDDATVRRGVAETLGRFGSYARPFLPTLEKLSIDTDEFVRKAAFASLSVLDVGIRWSTVEYDGVCGA